MQQKSSGDTLDTSLVKLGLMSEGDLLTVLSRIYDMPAVDLTNFDVDKGAVDLLPADERDARCDAIEAELKERGEVPARVYRISAAQREGTEALMYDILNYLEENARTEAEDAAETDADNTPAEWTP